MIPAEATAEQSRAKPKTCALRTRTKTAKMWIQDLPQRSREQRHDRVWETSALDVCMWNWVSVPFFFACTDVGWTLLFLSVGSVGANVQNVSHPTWSFLHYSLLLQVLSPPVLPLYMSLSFRTKHLHHSKSLTCNKCIALHVQAYG